MDMEDLFALLVCSIIGMSIFSLGVLVGRASMPRHFAHDLMVCDSERQELKFIIESGEHCETMCANLFEQYGC